MISHNFNKPDYEIFINEKMKMYTSCQGVLMKILDEGSFSMLKETLEKIFDKEINYTIQCNIKRT